MQFTILTGPEADVRLAGANSEFAGACEELRRRGATVVPLLYAHAMPSGPLDDASFSRLRDLVIAALRDTDVIDGLIVCLHGALSSTAEPSGDMRLLQAIRDEVGDHTPIALSLDLHANATAELVELAQVVTGYRTNPHVDQAETGRRAAALLCAVMSGDLVPTVAVATCPAIFPDESLRIPAGILGEVLDEARATASRSIVDVSVFPTQPWLDAPGIGFTTVVVAHDDHRAAHELAHAITRDGLGPPARVRGGAAACARRGAGSSIGERRAAVHHHRVGRRADCRGDRRRSGDAPRARPAGDRTERCWRRSSILLRCRPATKRVSEPRCRYASAARSTPGGAAPVRVDAEVVRVGDGDYPLTGVGYTGITVSMGRFAVVRRGSMQLLLTELPAWSADPGTWRHAGLDPYDDRRPGRSVVHRLHRELPGLGRDRGGRRRARSCDASTDAADVRALRRRAVPSRSDGDALTAAGNGYDTNAAFCFVADG